MSMRVHWHGHGGDSVPPSVATGVRVAADRSDPVRNRSRTTPIVAGSMLFMTTLGSESGQIRPNGATRSSAATCQPDWY
jgi:hypothetical protein